MTKDIQASSTDIKILQNVHVVLIAVLFFINSFPVLANEPFLYQSGHFVQLAAYCQGKYELSENRPVRPEILENESGLCGLFALYNGNCLLQACDNPSQAKEHLANLTSIETFHTWVEKHLSTLQKIKETHGRLGSFTANPLKKMAQTCFSDEQLQRICILNTYLKNNKYHQLLAIAQAANVFKNSRNPYLIIFDIGNHAITLVFDAQTTWIVDSNNTKQVSNSKIIDLDWLMRKDSLYAKPGYLEMVLAAPRKIIAKIGQYLPYTATACAA